MLGVCLTLLYQQVIKLIATTLNNEKQFSRVVLLRVKKPPHHHHHHHTTTTPPEWLHFEPLPGNLRSWVLVCNLILTQLEEIWKTTSIFLKMEDDLNFLKMEDDLNSFGKGKMTSFKIMQPNRTKIKTIFFTKMEDDLNIFKWKTT